MFNLYMPPFSMELVNCVLFEVSREAAGKMSHIWNVKRSDKKIAPHLKRQEKCHETKLYDVLSKIYLKMLNLYMAPFSMDLVNRSYLKCQEKRQEKWTTFEASREATRKSRHIWNVKRSDKKIVPHLKRQEKCHDAKLYGVLTKITNFYILSVKRSDKKNAPHFKWLEKRQEKCATFEALRKAFTF